MREQTPQRRWTPTPGSSQNKNSNPSETYVEGTHYFTALTRQVRTPQGTTPVSLKNEAIWQGCSASGLCRQDQDNVEGRLQPTARLCAHATISPKLYLF